MVKIIKSAKVYNYMERLEKLKSPTSLERMKGDLFYNLQIMEILIISIKKYFYLNGKFTVNSFQKLSLQTKWIFFANRAKHFLEMLNQIKNSFSVKKK